MKVYQMRLILGKEAQYNQQGKLKNSTIVPKYTGEMELTNILDDMNWKKVGACEIECVRAYEYNLNTKAITEDNKLKAEVNERIKRIIKGGTKPKTAIDLLREQNELLLKRLDKLESQEPVMATLESTNNDKGVDVAPLNKEEYNSSYDRVKLESKANELKIKFRQNIGDVKLLAKINEVEPEFKI